MKASVYMLEAMRGTRPWITFICVLGFLGAFVTILAGLLSGGMTFLQKGEMGAKLAVLPVALLFLINGGIAIYLLTRLWAFGSSIGQFSESGATSALQQGLAQHRQFWKAWGIITIVLMSLNVIATGILFFLGMLGWAFGGGEFDAAAVQLIQ